LKITLLSVGAGQCAVIEPAGGGAVLVDAGSSSSADVFRGTIEPFLRHEGRWSINSVWLSHGDYDHISAARQIVPEYGVRQVLTSPHFRKHAIESRPCQSLLDTLDHTHHEPRLVWEGNHIPVANQMEFEVLWPPKECDLNSNNAGLVLRVTCGGRSILFPADIQEPAERELLKHPERLRSDILVAPHHGSGEPTTAQFIRAVDPKVILSSNDRRLTAKQRTFETEVDHRPLYRTGNCGAITVTITRDGAVTVSPYVQVKSGLRF
jgi:competence protein ComEC